MFSNDKQFISSRGLVDHNLLCGVRQLTESLNPNILLFLALNRGAVSHKYGRRMIGVFFERLDKRLAGKYYFQRPNDRIEGIVIPEKWKTNSHFNCLLRVPSFALSKFPYRAEKIWRTLTKSGTANVQIVTDLNGAIEYSVKSLADPEHFENLILLREFWRTKSN